MSVLPASRDSFLSECLPSSQLHCPPARRGTLARAFFLPLAPGGSSVEGPAWPGEKRGPRRFAFPRLLLAAGLSALLAWRLATGGHGFPPSERLEFGGVFLGFCFICMFARVILFSLLAFVLTYCGKVTSGSVKPLPLRASVVHHDPPSPHMGGSPCLLHPPATHSSGGLTSGPQPPAVLRGWWTV